MGQHTSTAQVAHGDPRISKVFNDDIRWTIIQKLKPVDSKLIRFHRSRHPDPIDHIQAQCVTLVNGESLHDETDRRIAIKQHVIFHEGSGDPQHIFHQYNGFFSAVTEAWATHGNLVLSPDDVWLAIQMQFSRFVDANAEALRYTFVDHSDKKTLTVFMDDYDWPLFMQRMMDEIQANVKNNVNADFLPNFTTSTPLQASLKHLTVMHTMKNYFTYKMSFVCGIQKVGLLGTLDDWDLLRRTVDGLRKYHLKEGSEYFTSLNDWVDDLLVIIDQFIQTYLGRANVKFWNNVLHTNHGKSGCVPQTNIDGWLLTFLVGSYKQQWDLDNIPSARVQVPVEVEGDGPSYKVGVVGGFTGVVYDAETNTYQPQHSITVMKEKRIEDHQHLDQWI